jgi:putative ABC transport system permease protein
MRTSSIGLSISCRVGISEFDQHGLAIVLVLLLQSEFNKLLNYQLSLSYLLTKGLNGYSILIGLISIIVAGIFVSGLYPAFVLSSFKPIAVLKGKFSSSQKGIFFRKALVLGQFTVTIGLIIGSLVVMKQIRYMNKTQLGFNIDQVLVIKPPTLTNFDSTFISRVNSFKEELKQIAHVQGATTSWNVPGGDIGRSFNVRQADSAATNKFTVRHTSVDYDFLNVYGVKLIAGRNFKQTDHDPNGRNLRSMLINRSAANYLALDLPKMQLVNLYFVAEKMGCSRGGGRLSSKITSSSPGADDLYAFLQYKQ